MRHLLGVLLTITVVALCAAHAVDARAHRRAPKRTAPAPVVTPKVTASDTARDPEDVVIDRRIKGICLGC
jgi:hypothetical protein